MERQQHPQQQQQQQLMTSCFGVKRIKFHDQPVPILCQNENGACPILAIANTLFLRERLTLPPSTDYLTYEELLQHISTVLLEKDVGRLTEEQRATYEHTLSEALSLLPDMASGLDVNVKFDAPTSFEYTAGLGIFDLFNINVYHGWVVDPQEDVYGLLADKTYNQAVEMAITATATSSATTAEQAEGLAVRTWLQSSSQLTYTGLIAINTAMKPAEIGVLFRNNHFSVIYKRDNALFTLVTDAGFKDHDEIVWETLNNIEGDIAFLNADMKKSIISPQATSPTLLSSDALLAKQLQQEEDTRAERRNDIGTTSGGRRNVPKTHDAQHGHSQESSNSSSSSSNQRFMNKNKVSDAGKSHETPSSSGLYHDSLLPAETASMYQTDEMMARRLHEEEQRAQARREQMDWQARHEQAATRETNERAAHVEKNGKEASVCALM